MFKSITGGVFTFFYLYSVQFVFVPGHIGTRALIGILGLFYLWLDIVNHRLSKPIRVRTIKYFKALIPIVIMSLVAMGINGTGDAEFVKYLFSMILIFCGAYYIFIVLFRFGKYNLYGLIDIIKYVVIAQMVISLAMFFIPSVRTAIMDIQVMTIGGSEKTIEQTLAVRLVGFGSSFFGAGIINAFCLCMMSYKILTKKMTASRMTIEIFEYLFILLMGIFMSRITIAGLLMSLVMIIYARRSNVANGLKKLLPAFLILVPLSFFVYFKTIASNSEFEVLINQGFELVISASEGEGMESKSTNRLKEMYESYPSEISTYIFGDGYYSDPKGDGYYKHIDIGYFRLIYYFGVVGLLAYLFFQYRVMDMMRESMALPRYMLIILFGLVLIFNLKGFADFAYLALLFVFNELPSNYKNKFQTVDKHE